MTHRPLLVIDGDSLAHRAYHALPKSIRRKGDLGGGAIVGFANILLRLFESEQPRAVLVGWDTLGAPTYRQALFPAYQSGRQFDDELVEQLEILPELVAACGFANAKAAGYKADDFLAAAVAEEERRGGCAIVTSGDRDAFQLASEATTVLHPVRAGEMARIGPIRGSPALWRGAVTGAGFHSPAGRSVGQAAGSQRRRPERRGRFAAEISDA